ncbi:MAG: hypothetical protein WBE34_13245 [Candidatus Nitrosopolaris sp.]
MKDQNGLQAMRRYLLKHTVQMVQIQWTTEMKDRIHVLDLDMLSMYGQDDLHQLAFVVVVSPILISNNSYFGTSNPVYGQPDQMNSIQNIPVKKIHVGYIDIAYKTIGKGDPILLIRGASSV